MNKIEPDVSPYIIQEYLKIRGKVLTENPSSVPTSFHSSSSSSRNPKRMNDDSIFDSISSGYRSFIKSLKKSIADEEIKLKDPNISNYERYQINERVSSFKKSLQDFLIILAENIDLFEEIERMDRMDIL